MVNGVNTWTVLTELPWSESVSDSVSVGHIGLPLLVRSGLSLISDVRSLLAWVIVLPVVCVSLVVWVVGVTQVWPLVVAVGVVVGWVLVDSVVWIGMIVSWLMSPVLSWVLLWLSIRSLWTIVKLGRRWSRLG